MTSVPGEGQAPHENGDKISLEDAERNLDVEDFDLKKEFLMSMTKLFVRINIAVVSFIAVITFVENTLFFYIEGDKFTHMITEKVIMMLIGATTVQVGSIALVIARYYFTSEKKDLDSSTDS